MLLNTWQNVPEMVAWLLPAATQARGAYLNHKQAAQIGPREFVTWLPDTNEICVYAADDQQPTKTAGYSVVYAAADKQPDWNAEILIKKAALPVVGPTIDFAHRILGGPRPLSNAIVAGLLAGGLGYGAGTAVEQLFPERYISRGKLRRTLALAGLGGGALLGLNNAYANSKHMETSLLEGLLTRNDSVPDYPIPPAVKKAFLGSDSGWAGPSLYQPTVYVPQFNNAVWRDANIGMQTGQPFRTPPAYAAATSGLMSGLSAGTNSPIIRPVDVIRGIASAGVGLATATVAGKALSALAGLTPAGQQQLQNMGVWGGMMHAIVPSMFNLR